MKVFFKILVATSVVACPLLLGTSPACAGTGGQGGVLFDAFADAQDLFGLGPPLLDVESFDIRYDSNNLYFTLNFFTPIAPASAQLPESLNGALEFDVDENLSTGVLPSQNSISPPFATLLAGTDFFLDFLSELGSPGFVDLNTWDFNFVASIPVTFDDMAVHGTISLSDLGDDGRLNFTGLFGTLFQPTDATDKVGTSYSIPEPGAGIIFLAFLAITFGRRKTRG